MRPLADLLRDNFCNAGQLPQTLLPQDDLIDLVCIDLITQRRCGGDATVESFIRQFDCLKSAENRLDLIDAELCVRRELSSAWDADAVDDGLLRTISRFETAGRRTGANAERAAARIAEQRR